MAEPRLIASALALVAAACATGNHASSDAPAVVDAPPAPEPAPASAPEPTPAPAPEIPDGLRCLQRAYPEHVCALEANALVFCDGTRMAYDDGRDKTAQERLEDPDLEDQMAQRVAAGPATGAAPPAGHDPGRARHLPFFEKIYGDGEAAVRAKLVDIPWVPGGNARSVSVTRVGGVDERLREVGEELAGLAAEARKHAAQTQGTFNFRNVRGTARRSAHAFGIAIDVAPAVADYWRWRGREGEGGTPGYRNRVPLPIVHAFERAGFLWGGRWHHYDTMHFEYRPELMLEECRGRAAAQPQLPTSPSLAAPDASAYTFHDGGAAERLAERFAPPAGFTRTAVDPGSFAHWLRHLPLLPGRGQVHLHDGSLKGLQSVHAAVLDIDTGARDLQQCADAVMRLRAEYLFGADRKDEICFEAVSGKPLPYARWRRGERPPRGRAHPWMRQAARDDSHGSFRQYMDRVFGIANTASLRRELQPVADPRQVQAGDVYIEAASRGYFGHAVLVLDVAQDAAGERVFLIAQSYMPAQDMHVLINPGDAALSPWYRPTTDGSLQTPEWRFPPDSLRRFGPSCR